MKVFHADCLKAMKTLPDNSVDCIVTDPPYFIGFMGKKWDYSLPSVEVWKEALRVLKPGGHLLCFCGTRTYHRMVVNIEDAGFEVRDMIAWIYAQGQPHGTDIAKAIDKSGGGSPFTNEDRQNFAIELKEKRKKSGVSVKELGSWFPQYSEVFKNWERLDDGFRVPSEQDYLILVEKLGISTEWNLKVRAEDKRLKRESLGVDRRNDGTIYGLGYDGSSYESTTDLAEKWNGWNTALKPAQEPICLARKKFSGTVVQNVLEYGVGGINIKDCRIGDSKDVPASVSRTNVYSGSVDGSLRKETGNEDGHNPNIGRYPANVIHDGSDEVEEEFAKYGNRKSGSIAKGTLEGHSKNRTIYGHFDGVLSEKEVLSSEGSASRFFFCAKASKKDRAGSKHPTIKPQKLMEYLIKLVCPPGGVVLDPFAGSGSTAEAALTLEFDFILCEKEAEYIEDIKHRLQVELNEKDIIVIEDD